MSGNVWELSADRYDAEKEDSRLLRGGSWTNIPVGLRVSYQDWSLADLRFNCASISVFLRTFPNPVPLALDPLRRIQSVELFVARLPIPFVVSTV